MHKWTHYWNERPVNRPIGSRPDWTRRMEEEAAERRWELLLPHLTRVRRHGDQTIIDFGCGDGRYGRRLVAAGFEVHAVDVAPKRAERAQKLAVDGMTVHLIERGKLPFEDSSIDGLFTNVVLLHIPDDEFAATAAELRRVLKPGALLLMCENTTRFPQRTSHTGHVVFRGELEYTAAFPGARSVQRFMVQGEQDTVFAGRLVKSVSSGSG